jgi:hypothetical protein
MMTMGSSAKFVIAGLALAVLGGVVLAGTSPGPSTPGVGSGAPPSGPAIDWTTRVVELEAASFEVSANGLTFTSQGTQPSVGSDPGGPEYWTLEVEWTEQGLEQRLYLYFASDGTDWWVSEIRTRDGYDPAEWIYAYGPFFQRPLGEVFEGDVTIELIGQGRPGDEASRVPGTLTIEDMRLAVMPRSLEDLAVIPAGGGIDATDDLFRKGGALRCSGILLLPPAEALERLLEEGYRVGFRVDAYSGDDFDPTVTPEGVIEDYSADSYGNLLLFVRANPSRSALRAIRDEFSPPEDCDRGDAGG